MASAIHPIPEPFLTTASFDAPALPGSDEAGRLMASLRASSEDFEALFQRYGQPAPALRHYGLIQWRDQQFTRAIEALRAALVLTPDDADLWRDLAGAYDRSGDAELADRCVRQSLCHRSDDACSWLLLANLESRGGRRNEAEAAFSHAIMCDPKLGDAHFGLGLLHFERRNIGAAVASLSLAIANGYANALGFTTQGHLKFLAGDFAGSAAAFENAARFGPLDLNGRRKFARARTIQAMIEGNLDQAIADYPNLAGDAREELDDILRDAFHQLSAFGREEAAVAVGRLLAAQNPDDPVQRYLLDAVSGRRLVRAPVDYLESCFDKFAKTFDQKLVNVLQYQAPELMARLITPIRESFSNMLDLGCGTGLAAAHLAPFGGRLTGVDVSGGMLDEAVKRGLYADLAKAEAVEFLAGCAARFDLVFAADMLVYLGDLRPLFDAVARSSALGGLFVISVETTEAADYQLLPSGRFAHAVAYLERLARPDFNVLVKQAAMIRLEAGRPAEGMFLALERRP